MTDQWDTNGGAPERDLLDRLDALAPREPMHRRRPERPPAGQVVGFIPCWKTVPGKPGNCRRPEGHDGDCSPH